MTGFPTEQEILETLMNADRTPCAIKAGIYKSKNIRFSANP